MALTVSNNGAVAAASYYLGKNQDALQTSIKRLASGKKIVGGAQDPGTLAVSMKVNAAINRLSGAQNNIRNAQGFLEVQDGYLKQQVRLSCACLSLRVMQVKIPQRRTGYCQLQQ